MKKYDLTIFLAVTSIWLSSLLCQKGLAGDNSIKTSYVGSSYSLAEALEYSQRVCVGRFIYLGRGPLMGLSAGQEKFADAKVVIDEFLLGKGETETIVDYTATTQALNAAHRETFPKEEARYILFLRGPKSQVAQVVKLIPVSEENIQKVKAAISLSKSNQ